MTPIFDSLSHPTLTAKWQNVEASFSHLDSALKEENFLGSLAVGLAGVEGYAHESFYKACSAYPLLYPIAGIDPRTCDTRELDFIQNLGFYGVKVHPRYSSLSLEEDRLLLLELFKELERRGLPLLFCTYFHTRLGAYPKQDPLYSFIRLIESLELKIVLLHGGDVRLLEYAELVRFQDNLLLDLSLTICKYEGSSLDLDIAFLFSNFDRRICLGTDHPEYSHKKLRERFEHFSQGLEKDKRENIAHKNIMSFLGIL